MSKLPSEGEFNKLKSRIDIMENLSNVQRKKVEEQEKKILLLQDAKFEGKGGEHDDGMQELQEVVKTLQDWMRETKD